MARQKIVIDPVTRIEGHSKISIHLDEEGRVEEAYFHVTQFRGFEKFCEGRPFTEMPALMAIRTPFLIRTGCPLSPRRRTRSTRPDIRVRTVRAQRFS